MLIHAFLLLSLIGQTKLPSTPLPGAQSYGVASQPYLNGALLPSGMLLEAAPAGRARFQAALRIEEMTGDVATDRLKTIDIDFGKPSFAERWLLDVLRNQSSNDHLDRLEMVETLTARPVGDSIVLRRERALEGNGSVNAVNEATRTIERFLSANQVLLEVSISIYSQKAASEAAQEVRVTPLDLAGLTAKRAEFEGGGAKCDMLMAPTLTLYGGQPGELMIHEQEQFIKDYELFDVGGKKRAFPVIENLPSGLELSIQNWIDPDRDVVRTALALEIRNLTRPIRNFRTTLENGEAVTLDLPEWSTTAWSTSDLETTQASPGFMITGLRSRLKKEGAPDAELRDLTILGSIRKLAGLGEIATAAPQDSMVLGFDPATKKVFIQSAGKRVTADRIMFHRGGGAGVVGSGTVLTAIGDVLVVELKSGEAAAGDIAR